MSELNTPVLEFFCRLDIDLGDPIELGPGLKGNRRIIPIVGGSAKGPHFDGKVLNLGADWQSVHADATATLDTRYAIQTNDGATIEIINRGFRHGPVEAIASLATDEPLPPQTYYMRTHALLETGHPAYDWVNNLLFVGTGARNRNSVSIQLYVVR